MKKIILSVLAIGFAIIAGAQTQATQKETLTAFESAMLKNIKQLDTASSAATLVAVANNFERIGNVEKNKWEPFYYASYCYAVMAFMSPEKSMIDALADKAEAYLQKAEAVEQNNSEISCLFAMINSCRIMVDPVSRFQTKGRDVQVYLAKAKKENADNPRIYFLEASMQLRTPEAFGGGKKVAAASAETALEKFASFKAKAAIAPSWGEGQAKSLAEKINKAN